MAIEGVGGRGQERYVRWMLGVDGRTPGYMIRKEGKREKMRTRLEKKAVRFKDKLERGGASLWARRCWEEIKREEGRGSTWEKQRKSFYWERGISVEWVRRKKENGEEIKERLRERDIEVQKQERYKRIQKST